MPVDHLIEFNDLMPDRLEMELIKTGDLPLTLLGFEKMRPDLGYAGTSARKLFQSDCSKASEPKRFLTQVPDLVRTATQIAIFKAVDKRNPFRRLYIPNEGQDVHKRGTFTLDQLKQGYNHALPSGS